MSVEQLPWLARVVPNKVRFGVQRLHQPNGPICGLRLRSSDPEVEIGDVVLVIDLPDKSPPAVHLYDVPLAAENTPLAALYELISRYGLRVAYSEAASAEAIEFAEDPGIDDSQLVDLT